ncbi:hypothetical protein [Parasediminibacterium sp. JCM 36343]|uniref:hypothetical protein n=1 Tax=Parasediminibacterium sp. JCM 36343 TaxID=3374279 RepID=UPI00397C208A
MITPSLHKFHIPVMGLSYTIDTPLKVAKFGISSVISIVEDGLIEQVRELYSREAGIPYELIPTTEYDSRAKRITAYLNLVDVLIQKQIATLKALPFEAYSDITTYFELLPAESPVKAMYNAMLETENKEEKLVLQAALRNKIVTGAADVNIMAKLDKNNYAKNGELLPTEYSDALAGLRGFANSTLHSSVVLSAGYNPRLYNYIDHFPDFLPDEAGKLKKGIILKVSDYRSALTQGKILAKKGVWVSEFRIESGLNCGGHAFATDGLLLGPILEEFKQNKKSLETELTTLCNQALAAKGVPIFKSPRETRITVQGGIGTASEANFLLNYYQTNSTGWGSPFLLVPEATSVDPNTLQSLATAEPDDYYLSNISPLGVPFNSFRKATSEAQKAQRISEGRPGSPCVKKILVSNTEFSDVPICSASRKYQHLKIKQLHEVGLPSDELEKAISTVTEKDCLCEGLSVAVLLKNNITSFFSNGSTAVAICPGPNLAYFSGIFTLKQMVGHIYGRVNILNSVKRPNLFINELSMYVDYLKKEIDTSIGTLTITKSRQLKTFQQNLLKGIAYYKQLTDSFKNETALYIEEMKEQLCNFENIIAALTMPFEVKATPILV